ncbi:MAG: hypothetical protein LIO94_03625 [Clostridiales bacterium]|nr:hypothetical protein [Clostridiales bacterium]
MKNQITLSTCKCRFLKLFLLLGVLLISLSMIPAPKTEAATTKSAAVKAYNTFLKKAQKTDGAGKKFSLVYVNNDSIPELYYNGNLYTCKNGSVETLYEASVWELTTYYKKTGIVVEEYEWTDETTYESRTKVYSYSKVTSSGLKYIMTHQIVYSLDSDGKVTATAHSYYTETKTISAKTFKKKLARLTSSKKAKSLSASAYKNTAKNRKKYLK